MQRIVFFDFDGVIVDSFNLAYQLNKVKSASLTAEEYRHRFDGNIYEHFDPAGNANSSLKSSAFLDFFKVYTPKLMSMDYCKGIDVTIKNLSEAGYTLIINSSTLESTILNYLKLHGLEKYFAEILGPETDFSKVQKFHDALKNYRLKAHDAIFITDTLGDIREANQLELASIGVTWGYHDEETLKMGNPYKIVDHPDKIVNAVKDYFTQTKL